MWAGSRTRPIGGHTVSGSHASLALYDAPIASLAVVGGGDMHREPFRYRHLCYDQDAPSRPTKTMEEQEVDQTLTVAMLQMAPAALSDASVELNAQKAESFAREAKSKGADIVVMPEQWLVGYTATFPGFGSVPPSDLPTREVFRYTDQAIRVDGPVMNKFRSLARELGMAIAVSHLLDLREPLGGRPPHNSVTLIDRFGEVAYTYNKVHTCYWVVDEALSDSTSNPPVGCDLSISERPQCHAVCQRHRDIHL